MSRIAQFKLSGIMFRQALGMPQDTKIAAIYLVAHDTFAVIIEHPKLADDKRHMLQLADVPEITPIITRKNVPKPSSWLIWNWNNKEVEE